MSIDRGMGKEDLIHTHTHTHTHKHTHKGILLGPKKRNNAICGNIDGPRGYYSKWSMSGRERQIYGINYMWNIKKHTNDTIYKTEADLQI